MNPEVAETTVNLQMVESIVQLIRSLPSAEQSILEQKLYTSKLKSPTLPIKSSDAIKEPESIFEFFEEIHRQGPFRTPEQIDRDLQAERDAWDS